MEVAIIPKDKVSRRDFFKTGTGAITIGAAAGAALLGRCSMHNAVACTKCEDGLSSSPVPQPSKQVGFLLHDFKSVTGRAGDAPNHIKPTEAMDATKFLTHFDRGTITGRKNGGEIREYKLIAIDKNIEISRGVTFPAWTFNGMVPGPTLRATEGDLVRIHFINHSARDHTIHYHGIHPANMDGVFEVVPPGGYYVYEFIAEPYGVFLYHCHKTPLRKHIAKGMYGAFIIDPKVGREPATEMVMVMNGFDPTFTNEENQFYTVNGIAFHYNDNPIPLSVGENVRIYLVNMTEFDLLNSFHLHANMFKYWRTGTRMDHYEYTDTVMLCQGERGILEFSYEHPGKYLFHAHQNEFAELGWMGVFDVKHESKPLLS